VNTIRQLEAHGVSLDEIATALRTPSSDLSGLLHRLDEDVRTLRKLPSPPAPNR
jgi:hypothetical protein